MGDNTAPQRPQFAVGAVGLASVDFQDALDAGESLTGTVTCSQVDSTDTAVVGGVLVFANAAVNAAALTINNRSVAIGKGVQFKITGHSAAAYRVRIVVATGSTPAQTKRKWLLFDGVTE